MQLQINPHELILIGENSFVRLSADGGKTASTRCSHWRVLWSPAGAGHALFVDSGLVGGVQVYADSVPLARFLQKEIEYLLYKSFGDASLPVVAADFARDHGAGALEAYPMITQPGKEITWGELHVGSRQVFAEAGFAEVHRPSLRSVVMRVEFPENS